MDFADKLELLRIVRVTIMAAGEKKEVIFLRAPPNLKKIKKNLKKF